MSTISSRSPQTQYENNRFLCFGTLPKLLFGEVSTEFSGEVFYEKTELTLRITLDNFPVQLPGLESFCGYNRIDSNHLNLNLSFTKFFLVGKEKLIPF